MKRKAFSLKNKEEGFLPLQHVATLFILSPKASVEFASVTAHKAKYPFLWEMRIEGMKTRGKLLEIHFVCTYVLKMFCFFNGLHSYGPLIHVNSRFCVWTYRLCLWRDRYNAGKFFSKAWRANSDVDCQSQSAVRVFQPTHLIYLKCWNLVPDLLPFTFAAVENNRRHISYSKD